MRKAETKKVLLEHFVDDGKLKESVIDEFEVGMTSSDLKEVQLAKLKYINELATKHIRLVPKFYEDDVDKYFVMIEKVAHSLNRPKDKLVLLLQSLKSVLTGKAQQTYSALSITAYESYLKSYVKEAIKKAYE